MIAAIGVFIVLALSIVVKKYDKEIRASYLYKRLVIVSMFAGLALFLIGILSLIF